MLLLLVWGGVCGVGHGVIDKDGGTWGGEMWLCRSEGDGVDVEAVFGGDFGESGEDLSDGVWGLS